MPVGNLNALDVKRFGDKSLENFIRTDTATATTVCSKGRAAGDIGTIWNIPGRFRTRTSGLTCSPRISSDAWRCPPAHA